MGNKGKTGGFWPSLAQSREVAPCGLQPQPAFEYSTPALAGMCCNLHKKFEVYVAAVCVRCAAVPVLAANKALVRQHTALILKQQ